MSTLTTTSLTDSLGLRLDGLEVTRLLEDPVVPQQLLNLLDRHGVLLLRGLFLEPENQVALCATLGRVDYSPGHHRVPGIYWLTMDQSKNPNGDYLKATFAWHIDGCTPLDDEPPIKASVLTAVALGDDGAGTEFASSYGAYEDLSAEDQEYVSSLKVLHSFEASQRLDYPKPSQQQLARWRARPTHEHPLVWRHSNGRRSLVLTPTADYVIGMGYHQGRELLDGLITRATRPERIYRHHWQVGDTLIWDNRGVFHRAVPYEASSRREMLRTTLLGEEHIR